MNETRATRYQRLRRRAGAAGLVSAALVLGGIALTPLASWLAVFAGRTAAGLNEPAHTFVSLGVFVTLVVLLWESATLPATLYLARRVEARYSGAMPSVEDVLGAHFRGTGVAIPAAFVAAAVVLASRWGVGARWWMAAGGGLALVRALLVAGTPWLLARLARVRPISRPSLTRRLGEIASRARVPIHGIFEWTVDDTTTAALIGGAGRSRRVFISSSLVRDWSDDEVAVVVAHELAHSKHHDLAWSVAFDAAVIVAALSAAAWVVPVQAGLEPGTAELAALPLVGLVAGLVWFAATPLRHAQSRRLERRADVFALALTGQASAFGAAIRRLGDRHLAEERPSLIVRWLYHRHPSVTERLALAEAYRRVRGTA